MTLGKEATFLAHEDPTLLNRHTINFNSSGGESSDEYELDLQEIKKWKANLSHGDKERLRRFCTYDPFEEGV